MNEHDDGGPAFPVAEDFDSERGEHIQYASDGMTLRDYFAAKAMQAQCITDMVPGQACDELLLAAEREGQDPVYRLALNSYAVADAMLKARKQ